MIFTRKLPFNRICTYQVIVRIGMSGCKETLGQALKDVDEVHDGLGALDDLTVDGGLDVALKTKV